jgi:hypothetical protein
MYKEDHRFGKCEDENVKIWRYMSVQRYADMIRSSTLYFCSGERLQEEDPYEGSYLSFELLKAVPLEKAIEFAKRMKSCGYPVAVNCWHVNTFESLAMWKLYGSEIAVQSTVGRLIKAFSKWPCDVRIGRIHYITHGEDPFTSNSEDVLTPWIHKHRGFEYEQELRAVIWDTPDGMVREPGGSVRAPVDIGALIECVYIAPRAEPHVKDDVERMNGELSLVVPIHQSELAKPPVY